ncbi:GyrI-like domain-containing protein [bacterium]|nr:GyrI-like domain-containing protein [bacterium]
MKRAVLLSAISMVFLIIPAFSSEKPNQQELIDARVKLMDASFQSDSTGVGRALAEFEKLAQDAGVAAYVHYYLAFGKWQLALFQLNQNRMGEGVMAQLQAAIDHLQKAKRLKPDFADAYALNVSCHFPLYTIEPGRAREIAMTLIADLAKAKALAPENPRVVLVDAMNTFYTPEQFGGSQSTGITLFKRAVELFERKLESDDKLLPRWGHEAAYAWLANAYLTKTEPDLHSAKEAFERSLAVRPNFVWVKDTMLPQLERQLTQKDLDEPNQNRTDFNQLKEPRISTKKNQKMVVVEATGDPNVVGKDAFGLVFQLYYAMAETPKGPGQAAPRARWPVSLETPKSEWTGYYAIPVPESVTELPAYEAVPELKPSLKVWTYGEVAEILHLGPYDKEKPTLNRLNKFLQKEGYITVGGHEEEYIKGPTMSSPGNHEEYVTILRYRVKRLNKS